MRFILVSMLAVILSACASTTKQYQIVNLPNGLELTDEAYQNQLEKLDSKTIKESLSGFEMYTDKPDNAEVSLIVIKTDKNKKPNELGAIGWYVNSLESMVNTFSNDKNVVLLNHVDGLDIDCRERYATSYKQMYECYYDANYIVKLHDNKSKSDCATVSLPLLTENNELYAVAQLMSCSQALNADDMEKRITPTLVEHMRWNFLAKRFPPNRS